MPALSRHSCSLEPMQSNLLRLLLLTLIFACAEAPAPESGDEDTGGVSLGSEIFAVGFESGAAFTQAGETASVHSEVRIFDPEQAFIGYTLELFQRHVPTLIDMNGRVVHSWPDLRVRTRARLLPDGSLLALASEHRNRIVEYDWDGTLIWEYVSEEALAHHDFIRLENGNTLLLVRASNSGHDTVIEVNPAGEVMWRWRTEEHPEIFPEEPGNPTDVVHMNSLQELPENPWHAAGDTRFRPGNVLFSARHLNLIGVIDRETDEVVWSFNTRLDFQHEAQMIPPGFEHAGEILVLSNGYHGTYGMQESAVLAIHPPDGSITWEFRAPDFYTRTGGLVQPLPNGNVLINSDNGKRTFEITREGETVWQWTPTYHPVRSGRYAPDHCPQLAALERQPPRAVRPPEGYRHIDVSLYRFAWNTEMQSREIDGRVRSVLKRNNICRRLLLPSRATLQTVYGINEDRLSNVQRDTYRTRFVMRLRLEGQNEEIELFDRVLEFDGERERRHVIDLHAYPEQWVELCVATSMVGNPRTETRKFAWWANPEIRLADVKPEPVQQELTPEEIQIRKQHLQALGYVD